MPWLLQPNNLLLTMVVMSGLIGLVYSLRLPKRHARPTRIILTALLAATATAYALAPDRAGFVGLGVWFLLVGIPGWTLKLAMRRARSGQFGAAARLLVAMRWLRPWGTWKSSSLFYRALHELRGPQPERGRKLLRQLVSSGSPLAKLAETELLASEGNWQALVDRVEREGRSQVDPELLGRYVRALGELGRTDEMVEVVSRHRRLLELPALAEVYRLCRLFVFAFTGKVDHVRELLDGPLRALDPLTREAWTGTAELLAGDVSIGRARLERARAKADVGLAARIDDRLSRPLPGPDQLGEAARLAVAELERDWVHERHYAPVSTARPPVATYVLIGINLVVFAAEIALGGSTNLQTLLVMGALDPTRVLAGDWWRILTSQVLHFGPWHLTMNLLGLLLLGRFVEHRLGVWRYVVVYVVAGSLAMLGTVLLVAAELSAPAMVVGASGAIMGVVGASGAILLRGWWHERARAARRRLGFIVFIVVAQAALDLLAPGTSFSAHALGAVFGFIVAAPMVHMRWRRIVLLGASGLFLTVLGEHWVSSMGWRAHACAGDDVSACEEGCQTGDALSCAAMADRYVGGDGVERNPQRAATLYAEACADDVAAACNNLGTLFEQGLGVEQVNTKRAAELYDKACRMGSVSGCRNLGWSYMAGRGVSYDPARAIELFDEACDDGDEGACEDLKRARKSR